MEKLQAFISWYHMMGGKYNESYNRLIIPKLMKSTEVVSSFKERAEEVKRKWNHKFHLKDTPDISKINFERK